MRLARIQLAALSLCAAAALTGCQVVSGSMQYAQVRFIAASSDTPAVDLYQNGVPLLYNVPFGTASSYIPVLPGAYTYAVDLAGAHQQLAAATGTLAAGGQYTVLVGDISANLQMSVVRDQSTPATGGQAAVRFLHQASRTGAVDLYLVAPGGRLAGITPVASGVSFGNAPAYVSAPGGSYSIVAVPAGAALSSSTVPLFNGSQFDYPAGSARTIVLIDRQSEAAPGIEVLAADDVDAAGS